MEKEIWKSIVGYEGLYEISNIGRVKSLNFNRTWNEQIRKISCISKYWHSRIAFHKNWIPASLIVSRLVAIAFIPNPLNLPCVCHKDETLIDWRLYNWVENLFWWTRSDNMQDMIRKWRQKNHLKYNHPRSGKGKLWILHKSSKKINQYSLYWEFIRMWDAIAEVTRVLWIDNASISKCCNWKRKSAGWFIFKFT